jgi:hypothetical protein
MLDAILEARRDILILLMKYNLDTPEIISALDMAMYVAYFHSTKIMFALLLIVVLPIIGFIYK